MDGTTRPTPRRPATFKPTYQAPQRILDLVDTVETYGTGLIRFGADIFAMSGDVQQELLNTIDTCVRRTRDGQSHDGMVSLAGAWGHPTVLVFTRSNGANLEAVRRNFEGYMRLKRHQLDSDRSYGFLFNHDGELEIAMYFNSPSEPNPTIDALSDRANLKPAIDSSPPVPPSARRTTRRLRGKKRL